jgi:hypothetical protein
MSSYSIQERLVVNEWMRKKAAQVRRGIRQWRSFSSDLRSHFRTEKLFLSYGNVKLTHVLICHKMWLRGVVDLFTERWRMPLSVDNHHLSPYGNDERNWSTAFNHVSHKRNMAIKSFQPILTKDVMKHVFYCRNDFRQPSLVGKFLFADEYKLHSSWTTSRHWHRVFNAINATEEVTKNMALHEALCWPHRCTGPTTCTYEEINKSGVLWFHGHL